MRAVLDEGGPLHGGRMRCPWAYPQHLRETGRPSGATISPGVVANDTASSESV